MPRRDLFLRWCLAVAASAVAIWMLAPPPAPLAPRAETATNEGWGVPRILRPYDPAALAVTLARSELWGRQSEAASPGEETARQWRIAGLAGQGRERVVLVQFGDERSMPLKAGDKFPDGTPIAEIRENGVCVELGGKKRFLPLNNQFVPIVW